MGTNFVKRVVSLAAIAVILIALIVGNIISAIYSPVITAFFGGTGNEGGEDIDFALEQGDNLVQDIMAEGMVLFKNENNTLPLDFPDGEGDTMPINVLGWSATDDGFLLRGVGSGSSTIRDNAKVTLLQALEDEGFVYNQDIISMYESYRKGRLGGFGNIATHTLIEPPQSNYSSQLIADAKAHSNIALVVFSRDGGENIGEMPGSQTKYNLPSDSNRTQLQTSTEEEALLDMAAANFDKVIVIVNTGNSMHLDFLDDDRVDAAFFTGFTGQSGTRSIAKMLKGEINPSGKASSIYTYNPKADPTWENREYESSQIQYVEDIYYGYKWYETADAEGLFDDPEFFGGGGYEKFVQFPFGYGLSFTTFEWTVSEVNIPSPLTKTSEITVKVDVKNTGNVAGKDVVQVYYTPPYSAGGIEKAHVNLAAFAKTGEIMPGETLEDVTLTFSAYDMASYDCYDKNQNGFAGYELEAGSYQIKVMRDSHTVDSSPNAVTTFTLSNDILFDKDPVTNHDVENLFTGSTAYANVPMDGSTVGATTPYMTRTNFKASFPYTRAQRATDSTALTAAANFDNHIFDQEGGIPAPVDSGFRFVQIANEDGSNPQDATYAELNGAVPAGKKLVINEELVMRLGNDYDDPDWQKIIDQLSVSEVQELVQYSGFRTTAIASVGKARQLDFDGPAGFNTTMAGVDTAIWTAYPSATLEGCTFSQELAFIKGLTMGYEAGETGVSGWYAPGVNLHRSNYFARNFEYFGEDGVHNGKMAAMVVKGAKANGLYCYLKHFALSELGQNPRGIIVWATEQNFRENYLRPFEIAVKEGKLNAMMTAFNYTGAVWAGANYAMNITILRDEWGFRGTVLTDYTTSGEDMGVQKGLRGGNDIWLNPNATGGSTMRTSNATDVYLAKNSAKNVLYTYANTYAFAKDFDLDGELADLKAKLGVRTPPPVFPWWIFIVVAIDLVVVAGLGFWAIMILKPELIFKNKKQTA